MKWEGTASTWFPKTVRKMAAVAGSRRAALDTIDARLIEQG